jgi:hypothetical protein
MSLQKRGVRGYFCGSCGGVIVGLSGVLATEAVGGKSRKVRRQEENEKGPGTR